MKTVSKSETIKWKEYLNTLEKKCGSECSPMQMTFEITPLCNFNCKMCYVHLSKEEQQKKKDILNENKWLMLADKCRDAGILSITFTGGEVFTYPDFNSLYEKVYDKGFLVNILSNGYLITDEIIARLKKRKPHKMRITLYGASDETYFSVTGIRNGYSKVSENILKLKEAGINIGVSMTVVKDNVHDFQAVKEWVKRNGLVFVYTCRIHLPHRGMKNLAKQIRIVDEDFDKNLDISLITRNDQLIEKYRNNAFHCCNSCEKSAVITWEGKLQGCLSIVNCQEDAFSDDFVVTFRRLWSRLLDIKTPEKCLNCNLLQYCVLCPGSLAAESGKPDEVSPYVCAMARWTYNRIINRETDLITGNNCD